MLHRAGIHIVVHPRIDEEDSLCISTGSSRNHAKGSGGSRTVELLHTTQMTTVTTKRVP